MGHLALVIDQHIVGDIVDMMAAREAKIRKYSDNPNIDAAIKSRPGVADVRHYPLIITSRGIRYHKSAETSWVLACSLHCKKCHSKIAS